MMLKRLAPLMVASVLLAGQAQAVNLLRNASFMDAGSGEAPDYWSWQGGPIQRPDWPACWQMDGEHFIAGTRTLRLADTLGQPVNLLSIFFSLPPGQTYTFSVYLKADRDGAPVQMVLGDLKSQTIKASKAWQRYSLTATLAPNREFRSCVRFANPGNEIVWINAPQLEVGERATDFAVAPADAVKLAPGQQPPQLRLPLPKLTLPVTTVAPKIDGLLDDECWRHAAVARDFRRLDDVAFASEKTEAFILRDTINLYLAFRCHESEMDKLTARVTGRDANIFADDVAEFFISPHRDGSNHLQFAVNPLGTVWDSLGSERAWNAPGLQVKTGREPGAWTAEFSLPLADLQLPPTTDSTWRISFARERAFPKREELSTWAPVVRTFHDHERYGFLTGLNPRALARFFVKPTPLAVPTAAAPPPPLSAYCDRSFYTTETTANVVVRLTKPGPVKVDFQSRTFAASVGKQGLIPLPIVELPCGSYPVQVTAGSETQALSLQKLSPQANAVKMDRLHRTLLVDDKLFFPFATSASAVAHIEDQAGDGFNTVITLLHNQTQLEPYQALFDAAQAHGMKVIVWFSIGSGKSYADWHDGLLPLVERYRNHPALLAWYVIDEPAVTTTWLKQLVADVKTADPYHPAFVNWCGQWLHTMDENGGDFESEDVYPIGRMSNDEAMKMIADTVGAMNQDAVASGKVLSFWHVCYGSYDSPREPTPLEEQCLSYTSLVHGCHALYYYLYKPMSVSLWKSMLPLSQEIQALAPACDGEEVTSQIAADNPAIHYAAFAHGGTTYLVTVNTKDTPQRCWFGLGRKTRGSAEVLFEDRRVSCQGSLADDFGRLARHVYLIR